MLSIGILEDVGRDEEYAAALFSELQDDLMGTDDVQLVIKPSMSGCGVGVARINTPNDLYLFCKVGVQ